jgi:large subunit ribosomal protein L22
MAVRAIARNVLVSPRKAGVVAGLVRGRTVEDALTILEHTPRRPAKAVREVIKSAKANAEHDHQLKPGSLHITLISVTPGPRYRRFRPAARGRALPYKRQTSHIRVEVDGEVRQVKKPASPAKKETK